MQIHSVIFWHYIRLRFMPSSLRPVTFPILFIGKPLIASNNAMDGAFRLVWFGFNTKYIIQNENNNTVMYQRNSHNFIYLIRFIQCIKHSFQESFSVSTVWSGYVWVLLSRGSQAYVYAQRDCIKSIHFWKVELHINTIFATFSRLFNYIQNDISVFNH